MSQTGQRTAMGQLVSSLMIAHLLVRQVATSARPDLAWLGAARSGGQGWPKAIAKRLALEGRDHTGGLAGSGRDWTYPPGRSKLHEDRNHDQSCASAAKLRGAHVPNSGMPPPHLPPDGASPPPPKERCPNARTARDFEILAAAFARNNFPQVDWPDGCTLLKGSVLGRLPPNSGTRPPAGRRAEDCVALPKRDQFQKSTSHVALAEGGNPGRNH